MMGVVIYKSKYGATAQYAQWISASLKLPLFEIDELDYYNLNKYDFIVLGSSVYIGKLLIKKWLKNNLAEICNKKIFLFVVCSMPLDQKDKLDSYITASVPAEIRNRCNIFFLPGKLKIQGLSFVDNFMLKMGARLAKSKAEKKSMLTDYNEVKKENVTKLINALNKIIVKSSNTLIPAS